MVEISKCVDKMRFCLLESVGTDEITDDIYFIWVTYAALKVVVCACLRVDMLLKRAINSDQVKGKEKNEEVCICFSSSRFWLC